MGARIASTNHLEACYPTIVMDYLPAIYDADMADYLHEFETAMPAFAKTAKVGGSYEGTKPGDYYRSPVEFGWTKNIRFDHDFIGRAALEREVANPRRTIRTLVWNTEDVVDGLVEAKTEFLTGYTGRGNSFGDMTAGHLSMSALRLRTRRSPL